MHPLADYPVDAFADEIGNRDTLGHGNVLERCETLVVDVKVCAFHEDSAAGHRGPLVAI
jgi:hypothetical protein